MERIAPKIPGDNRASFSSMQPVSRARKNVTRACNQCRKKRVRCDGQNPCKACHTANVPCTYDELTGGRDLRTQRPRSQEIEQLVRLRHALETLIALIQEDKAEDILQSIREGAATETVLDTLLDIATAFPEQQSLSVDDISANDALRHHHAGAEVSDTLSSTSPGASETKVEENHEMEEADGIDSSTLDEDLENYFEQHMGPSNEISGEFASQSTEMAVTIPDRSTWHPSLQLRHAMNELIIGRESQIFPGVDNAGSSLGTTEYIQQQNYFEIGSITSADRHIATDAPKNIILSKPDATNPSKRKKSSLKILTQQQQTASTGSGEYSKNMLFLSAVDTDTYSPANQHRQTRGHRTPKFLRLPMTTVDQCPLGRVYTDFWRLGHHIIQETGDGKSLLGDLQDDAELLFRQRQAHDPINASTWACDLNRGLHGTFEMSVHAAYSVMLTRLMRWLLFPCAKTYEQIPHILRPTRNQTTIGHASIVDIALFANVRDALINELKDFISSFQQAGLTVSWPHTLNEVFVFNWETGRLQVSKRFADHVCDSSNWKIGRAVLNDFPGMADDDHVAELESLEFEDRYS